MANADPQRIIIQIKNYFFEHYAPAQSIKDADFHYSTQELWQKLFSLFPDVENFSPNTIASWLVDGGFIFEEFGELKFEWLLKKNVNLEKQTGASPDKNR